MADYDKIEIEQASNGIILRGGGPVDDVRVYGVENELEQLYALQIVAESLGWEDAEARIRKLISEIGP